MTDSVGLAGYALVSVAGIVSGFLNVLAGGGSFLTLPVLIFLGLPPGVANGTNRVGVLMQNLAGVAAFHRHRVLDVRLGLTLAVPAVLGSLVGARLAVGIGDATFQRVLALLMVGVTLLTLWNPIGRLRGFGHHGTPAMRKAILGGVFFLIGIYGGFVQAGIGFFVIAALVATGLDLVRTNALKLLIILILTVPAFGVFVAHGKVEWVLGAVLGLGNAVGGQIAVHVAIRKGHAWIRGFVMVMVIVFALKLLTGQS